MEQQASVTNGSIETGRALVPIEDVAPPAAPRATPATATVAQEPAFPAADLTARYTDSATKILMLLNGAAAVAVLTFAGNAARPLGASVAPALTSFGWGAGTAVIAAATACFAQLIYTDPAAAYERKAYGNSLRTIALTAGVISIGAFMHGLGIAARALSSG